MEPSSTLSTAEEEVTPFSRLQSLVRVQAAHTSALTLVRDAERQRIYHLSFSVRFGHSPNSLLYVEHTAEAALPDLLGREAFDVVLLLHRETPPVWLVGDPRVGRIMYQDMRVEAFQLDQPTDEFCLGLLGEFVLRHFLAWAHAALTGRVRVALVCERGRERSLVMLLLAYVAFASAETRERASAAKMEAMRMLVALEGQRDTLVLGARLLLRMLKRAMRQAAGDVGKRPRVTEEPSADEEGEFGRRRKRPRLEAARALRVQGQDSLTRTLRHTGILPGETADLLSSESPDSAADWMMACEHHFPKAAAAWKRYEVEDWRRLFLASALMAHLSCSTGTQRPSKRRHATTRALRARFAQEQAAESGPLWTLHVALAAADGYLESSGAVREALMTLFR